MKSQYVVICHSSPRKLIQEVNTHQCRDLAGGEAPEKKIHFLTENSVFIVFLLPLAENSPKYCLHWHQGVWLLEVFHILFGSCGYSWKSHQNGVGSDGGGGRSKRKGTYVNTHTHTHTHTLMCLVAQLCPTLCDLMDCSLPGSSVYGNSLGKNAGVDCHALLQGIFPTQGSSPGFLYCRQILYHLSYHIAQQVFVI